MKQNTWFDPFFIFENLSEEDKLIQKNVKQFCNAELRPNVVKYNHCLLYTSPSPRDQRGSRMPSSA